MEGRWGWGRHLHAQGEPRGAVPGPSAHFEPRDTESGSSPSTGQGCPAQDGAVPAAPTSCPSLKSGKRFLIPCLVPPATCWRRGQLSKGITEQGGEGSIAGPPGSSGKGLAGCSRGHGSGGIRSCLRLPTPNPFATFRLPEAVGSGRRKGVPRAGAGASEAQPKVGGRGCAEPKLRRLQTLSIPHRSRLPPAQRWTHARRAAGPRRLRAGGDRESRSGTGSLRSGSSPLGSASRDPSSQHIPGGARASARLLEPPHSGRARRGERDPAGAGDAPLGAGTARGAAERDRGEAVGMVRGTWRWWEGMGALQDGLVQVDFEGQRPRVLPAGRGAQGDRDDGRQRERAGAIQVLQVLLVPVDAQRLEERPRQQCRECRTPSQPAQTGDTNGAQQCPTTRAGGP